MKTETAKSRLRVFENLRTVVLSTQFSGSSHAEVRAMLDEIERQHRALTRLAARADEAPAVAA